MDELLPQHTECEPPTNAALAAARAALATVPALEGPEQMLDAMFVDIADVTAAMSKQ